MSRRYHDHYEDGLRRRGNHSPGIYSGYDQDYDAYRGAQNPGAPPPSTVRSMAGSTGLNNLMPPTSAQRPRSVPPFSTVGSGPMMTPASGPQIRGRSRSREWSRSRSRSRDRDRDHRRDWGPIAKAEDAVKNTFTASSPGLGIGILGAIVGGLAARHISEATESGRSRGRHGHHNRDRSGHHESRLLLSTVIGAAVGGLGANALEAQREKNEEENRGRSRHEKVRPGLAADYYNNHPYNDRHEHHHRGYDGHGDHDDDHVYDQDQPRRRRSLDETSRNYSSYRAPRRLEY